MWICVEAALLVSLDVCVNLESVVWWSIFIFCSSGSWKLSSGAVAFLITLNTFWVSWAQIVGGYIGMVNAV